MSTVPVNDSYCEYDLSVARRELRAKQPAAHQREALAQLSQHFEGRARLYDGGILVLPTGGGKTFTAVRFLCTGPLSPGFKVLWLAHTHHLLDQALKSFTSEVGLIAEPKPKLNVRVVSGAPGHNAPSAIKPTDDIVIGTLQTIGNAKKHLGQFNAWLKAAGERLLIVFDEAHHAPAYSYRTLITSLRDSNPGMYLLGLTATPTYTDERRSSFLNTLFPQRCIYQVATQKLMAQSILARPVFEDHRTDFDVAFDEREYQKWIGSYRDLPEEIISKLAASKERNPTLRRPISRTASATARRSSSPIAGSSASRSVRSCAAPTIITPWCGPGRSTLTSTPTRVRPRRATDAPPTRTRRC